MEVDYQLLLDMWGYGSYGGYGGMMSSFSGLGLFALLTWVALVLFLVLGIAYFWKEISKPKGKR